MPSNTPILVSTTSNDKSVLENIANQLVEKKLAACCQLSGPVTSVYRWKDAIETSEEFACNIKTTNHRFPAIKTLIAELHNYEEPEIIAVEIFAGSNSYMNWILSSCISEI